LIDSFVLVFCTFGGRSTDLQAFLPRRERHANAPPAINFGRRTRLLAAIANWKSASTRASPRCLTCRIPAADFRWSLDLLVDDLFAVADAAGLPRFHLVGESIGGTVALAAALARPARIATLTVSNGAHLGASIQRVEAWRRQLDEGGSKGWSDAFLRDRFHDDALSAERRAWFAAEQEKWSRDSILNALGVLIGTDLTPRLADMKCPTLLLHPDGSPFIPASIMAALHEMLPDSELNVFGRSRHGLPFSHAAQCAQALRTFLDLRQTD